MYSINPTSLFHGKPAEWGCLYGFGYRSSWEVLRADQPGGVGLSLWLRLQEL